MNIDTQLMLHAYGTAQSVQKSWDTRGRGKSKPQFTNTKHEEIAQSLLQKHRGNFAHAADDADRMGVHFPQGSDAGFWQRVKGHLSTMQHEMKAAGCKGANCGRKGKKAGATPLRSFMTKQETNTLKSKALKFKRRRKY